MAKAVVRTAIANAAGVGTEGHRDEGVRLRADGADGERAGGKIDNMSRSADPWDDGRRRAVKELPPIRFSPRRQPTMYNHNVKNIQPLMCVFAYRSRRSRLAAGEPSGGTLFLWELQCRYSYIFSEPAVLE
jgi:hypothetical protein